MLNQNNLFSPHVKQRKQAVVRTLRAAMFELDPEKLPERIIAPNEAVKVRLKDIQGDADHHAERQEIEV